MTRTFLALYALVQFIHQGPSHLAQGDGQEDSWVWTILDLDLDEYLQDRPTKVE